MVGAGFSGVETVAEMRELVRRALKYYPNIKPDEIRFYLIEYADRILPTFSPDLADYATRRLEIHGIEVLTRVGTKSATGTGVELTDGRFIPTSTIVATIGNGPHRLVATLGLDMHWGRIKTDHFMRVPGHDGVWALGDAALIPMIDEPKEDPLHYAPQTAQFAVREGRQLAANIVAKLGGKDMKPFAYVSKGSLASLGMSKAVADVYGVKLSGTFAWLLWRGFYLSFLPGFQAKLRVGINWLVNSVMPPNIVQIQSTPPATRYIHYRKGDKVFEPGMLIDGFYTVTKGRFKLTIDNPETGEHFEKVFGPGEHFGERVLLRSALRTGLVVALEDGVLLFIAQKDFTRFARAFPFLDNYFKDYIERTFGGTTSPSRLAAPTPKPSWKLCLSYFGVGVLMRARTRTIWNCWFTSIECLRMCWRTKSSSAASHCQLLLGIGVKPIHVDVDVEMTDAGVRIVLESVAIVSAEEFVQRGDDLALADIPLTGKINVTERAPSRPLPTFSDPATLVSTSWNWDLRTTSCSFQKPFWRTAYSSRKSGRTPPCAGLAISLMKF